MGYAQYGEVNGKHVCWETGGVVVVDREGRYDEFFDYDFILLAFASDEEYAFSGVAALSVAEQAFYHLPCDAQLLHQGRQPNCIVFKSSS